MRARFDGWRRRVQRKMQRSMARAGSAWRRSDTRTRRGLIGGLAGVVALIAGAALWDYRDVPGHWLDTRLGHRPLMAARTWHYNLDKIDLDKLAANPADVLVIDFALKGGREPLTRSEVARLQTRPGGGRRIVISYLSIGEAESYRWYWRDSWTGANMPDWQVAENCAWPKAHMVRFWHHGWKDIIYRGASSYLQRIVDAGFDGVYLDRVDIYGFQTKERPSGRADMIDFVAELAAAARKLRPGFLVIPQNADELLADRRYRRVIDGLGREDLINGEHATGGRNKPVEIGTALARLAKLQRDYKPVFVVEYLATQPAIATAEREIRALGMVPTFAHRSLDGDDPTRPRPDEQSQIGTPEWTAANCRDKPHW